GIVLVGFRLSLSEVAALGPRALVAVCLVVVITFFGTQWLGRRLGLSRPLSLLVATGYSICGASAIAAAEPFSDASEEEVAYAIALVTLCGSLAIGVLPPLGGLLGLSSATFGAWVGASVHDVGQVVAAASTRDATALKSAVVVKLTRVALLAPLLTGIAISKRRRDHREMVSVTPAGSADSMAGERHNSPDAAAERPPILPLFIVMFLVAVIVRSTGIMSTGALSGIKQLETLMLGVGLAGLGSGVNVRRLRTLGGKPLVLGLASWIVVAAASLAAVTIATA
ncbi:MAG: putative sulfate exporter family transporter, partial [Ilumatobacteraceae bacterium]